MPKSPHRLDLKFRPAVKAGAQPVDVHVHRPLVAVGIHAPDLVQQLQPGEGLARVNLLPKNARTGAAYAISKYFVIWYARHQAARFGAKGVRVLSITPGNFDTPMGELEAQEAGSYLKFNAIQRPGRPEEIAALYAACADPAMGYLTGADILCDGGCVASGAGPFSR